MFGLGPVEMMIILFVMALIGIGLTSVGQKAAAKEKADAEPDLTSSQLPGANPSFPTPAEAKYCERCANSIEDPKDFCPFCGVQL